MISGRHTGKGDRAIPKVLSQKMTVKFNVFGLLVKDIIMRYMDGTLTIIVKWFRLRLLNTQVREKLTEPDNFRGGVSKRYDRLFLTLLRNQRITKKEKKPSGRLVISDITSPITIRISRESRRRVDHSECTSWSEE